MKNTAHSISMPISAGVPRDRDEDAVDGSVPLARKLVAELIGTFMLTLVAAGAPVMAAADHAAAPAAVGAVAVGLVLMAMIYSIGPISGSHINPAVTLGFALRGCFRWSRVMPYWGAQILGAILAASLLRAVFGDIAHLGATVPAASTGPVVAFIVEAALTTMFVLVILATSEEAGSVGANAAIAIGGTLALCGLFAGDPSGASLNPARSIGPGLLGGTWPDLWVYIGGPLLGAAIAVGLDTLIHGSRRPTHEQAEGR
jgi:aquaporin Z